MNILEILRNRYERNSTHPRCYTLRNFAKTTTKIHPRNESMKCVVEARGISTRFDEIKFNVRKPRFPIKLWPRTFESATEQKFINRDEL